MTETSRETRPTISKVFQVGEDLGEVINWILDKMDTENPKDPTESQTLVVKHQITILRYVPREVERDSFT